MRRRGSVQTYFGFAEGDGVFGGSLGPIRSESPVLDRIGRNPSNDIQISVHCEMHVSPLGIAFRDVGSRNGSFIEGRRVEKEILSSGGTLRLGAIDLDLHVRAVNIAIPEQKRIRKLSPTSCPMPSKRVRRMPRSRRTFAA